MEKTNIEKLMELKQLYESGILTKEEMEAEKQKILGSQQESQQQEVAQRQQDLWQEPVAIENNKPSNNRNKYYVIAAIVILLCLVAILVPKLTSTSETPTVSTEEVKETQKTIALKGRIDNKIGFSMHLTIKGSEIEGTEHYDSQKSDVTLSLKGTIDDTGHVTLHEYDNQTESGVYEGVLNDTSFTGTFKIKSGKPMQVTADVMDAAALKRVEAEALIIEVKTTSFAKNSGGVNVEIIADYPVKANDLLLASTRNYVCGVIAGMFDINSNGVDKTNGQSAVNTLGNKKFARLKKEKTDDEASDDTEYTETVEVKMDFENDKCVSFCGQSYFCHGGVGNYFCVGATFRKVDGKQIRIFKNPKDATLKNALKSALRKKMGGNYDMISDFNEGFADNPMPRELPHMVEDGVEFDYQHYEIGPGAFGQISVVVPYSKIKQCLTKEALNLIE